MNFTVYLALFGFVPLSMGLFAVLSVRRAILCGMVTGWLFLPMASLRVTGIPDFDKIVATNLGVFLGCVLLHWRELFAWRPTKWDLPMLLWLAAPSLSSLSNDLGLYDAASMGVRQFLVWFLPYWMGRTFFRDGLAFKELATAMVIGGLIYVPFCLFEVRMSPQLHKWAYGFERHQFLRNVRFAGYRPSVFMESGLMVGMWMANATIIAFWLRLSGQKRLGNIAYEPLFALLLITTILCKALYAILLTFAAILLLAATRFARTSVPIVLLLACVPAYMVVRGGNWLASDALTQPAAQMFGEDRAQSLGARLYQEDAMLQHAVKRPVFGWGGWRRTWPIDPATGSFLVRGVDGMWLIALSETGFFGLFSLFAALLLPVIATLPHFRAAAGNDPKAGAITVMGICLLMFTLDCLLNGMFNPLYALVAGGLTSARTATTQPGLVETPAWESRGWTVARRLKRINGS